VRSSASASAVHAHLGASLHFFTRLAAASSAELSLLVRSALSAFAPWSSSRQTRASSLADSRSLGRFYDALFRANFIKELWTKVTITNIFLEFTCTKLFQKPIS
jgi:hypothetical protein